MLIKIENLRLNIATFGICDIILVVACMCGGMVDAADSKSAVGNYVWVQVPSHAPLCMLKPLYTTVFIFFGFLKLEKNCFWEIAFYNEIGRKIGN